MHYTILWAWPRFCDNPIITPDYSTKKTRYQRRARGPSCPPTTTSVCREAGEDRGAGAEDGRGENLKSVNPQVVKCELSHFFEAKFVAKQGFMRDLELNACSRKAPNII